MTYEQPIPVQYAEVPAAQDYETRWHNGHQLVGAQLTVLRHRAGVADGQHTTERNLDASGLLSGRAEVMSHSAHAARITLDEPEVGARTRYDVDAQAGTLAAQAVDANGEGVGDVVQFAAGEAGDAALAHVRAVLFAVNSIEA